MNQIEAIKKISLLDVRISAKKVFSFRVRFRKKGYPDQIKTFQDEKLARQWLAEQERNGDKKRIAPGVCVTRDPIRDIEARLSLCIGAHKTLTEQVHGWDLNCVPSM
ncbi:MAG: hypothetical protein BGO14_00160 [Chlamydiales bacterium 38-26]|nr:hypothetical protein [Chlamydiales bacterium]OJV07478.1 MAG: hypothetical protein BGO14_00160 [Chlamydiales bacterium 38-26]